MSGVIKLKPTSEYGDLPLIKRHTDGSVGLDLYCAEGMAIMPRERVDIPCGLKIQLPEGHYARITGRSSTFMLGLDVREGVIDEDYRGELFVGVYNFSDETVVVERGARLSQMIIYETICPEVEYVDRVEPSRRGEGGFGSTSARTDDCEFLTEEFFRDVYEDQCLSPLEISRRYKIDKGVILEKIRDLYPEAKIYERPLQKLTKLQRDLMTGCVLGNMKIIKRNYWQDARCEFSHAPDEIDYLRYKKDILGKFVTVDMSADYDEVGDVRFKFHTITHPIFSNYLTKMSGVPIDYCTHPHPFSLSIWCMDSGSIVDGKLVLDHSDSQPGVSAMAAMHRWMVDCGYESVHDYANCKIRLNSVGTMRFMDTVERYLIPSMRHKFGRG